MVETGHEVLVVGPPGLGPTAARWDLRSREAADPAEVGAIMSRAMSMRHEDAADMVIGEVFTRLNSGALVSAMRAAIVEFRPHLVLRDPAEFACFDRFLGIGSACVQHRRSSTWSTSEASSVRSVVSGGVERAPVVCRVGPLLGAGALAARSRSCAA